MKIFRQSKLNIALLSISVAFSSSVYAAKPVIFKFQPATSINNLLKDKSVNLKQINKATDVTKITHVRLKEYYLGYPVWGADVIVHGQNTVSGIMYSDLSADLGPVPIIDSNKAIAQAVSLYQKKSGNKLAPQQPKCDLMVYIDNKNKAHWTYLISFIVKKPKLVPEKPTFILDHASYNVYEQWDDIHTIEETLGGGFGGNEKMGKLIYDGIGKNLPKLPIQRDEANKICYLKNAEVTVKDVSKDWRDYQFTCEAPSSEHDNIFWQADLDAVNGSYSQSDDALFTGKVVKDMYQNWYGVPVLVDGSGKPKMLTMCVHEDMENAYWDGEKMVFGDGGTTFYPLVSLGVAAHEVSHGFTEQHSMLVYNKQSGGLNESFSDMASQAAELYAYGHNSWQIGPEIFKAEGQALRYMDEPTKDGYSISHMKDYDELTEVHSSSGIFNKVFYLMGTAEGWDARKAFDVMVKANQSYWRSTTDFHNAANCVLRAAKDFQYDLTPIKNAFDQVGIYGANVENCY